MNRSTHPSQLSEVVAHGSTGVVLRVECGDCGHKFRTLAHYPKCPICKGNDILERAS